MRYTKQTWATGDTITAAKLNHMEDGIAGGGALIIGIDVNDETYTYTLDKTWSEIDAALRAGVPCYTRLIDDYEGGSTVTVNVVTSTVFMDGGYTVSATPDGTIYTASTADSYPSFTD